MMNIEVKPERESSWTRWRILRWCGGAVIVLPLVALLIFRASVTLEIKRLEKRARERGEPLTMEEINAALPKVPNEENAALAIVALWKEDRKREWNWREYDDVPGIGSTTNDHLPFEGKELVAAEKFRTDFTVYYRELGTALERPHARWSINLNDQFVNDLGFVDDSRHLSRIKHETASLRTLARLAVQEGRTGEALVRFETMARLANTLKNDRDISRQLVRISCVAIAISTIAGMVSWGTFSVDELNEMESLRDEPAWRLCLIQERATGLQMLSMTADELNGTIEIWPEVVRKSRFLSEAALGGMRLSGWWGLDRRYLLDRYDRALADTNDAPGNLRTIMQVWSEIDSDVNRFPRKYVSGFVLHLTNKVVRKFYAADAFIGSATVIIAIERYRLSHEGELPLTLGALKDYGLESIPLDPFDGHPMRYRIDPAGYRVYSIDWDFKDNNGEMNPVSGRERDISLIVTIHHEAANDGQ